MANIVRFKRRTTAKQRFESIVRPHFDALYKSARRMTLSPYDAEDLLQEVFIKAYAEIDKLADMRYPRAWLLKVMYNQFIDMTRRDSRSPVELAETGVESVDPDVVATSRPGPEDAADTDQRLENVVLAMQRLGSERCALVAMHDLEGFSIAELCELTGMPEGTIKSQLHRTRQRLGQLLSSGQPNRPRFRIVGGKQ